MANNIDKHSIHRFLSGECTPQEKMRVINWIDADPVNRKYYNSIKKIWDVPPVPQSSVDSNKAWVKVSRKVGIKRTHFSHNLLNNFKYQGYLKSTYNLSYMRVAAIILVSIFTGYLVQNYVANLDNTEQIAEYPVMKNMVTGNGEKSRVTFSDGTEVVLNAASSLQFPEKFHQGKREVYLDGEAFFEVASNSEHPFIVHTQGVDVEVLGTEFNIRGWSQDSTVDVAVREGKVSVTSLSVGEEETDNVILSKGFYTRVEKGRPPLSPREVDIRNNLLWLSGGLYFDEEPFRRVITELERRFDVQISVASNEILETPYTGKFQYAELDEILTVITATMEIGYSRNESDIHFE